MGEDAHTCRSEYPSGPAQLGGFQTFQCAMPENTKVPHIPTWHRS
jgi:hypothetical protein